jgi:hypothetical protein
MLYPPKQSFTFNLLKFVVFYFDMAIPVLGLISNLCKPQSRHAMGRAHLMLAGIHQEVFLRQWGMPEIHISFNHFQEIFRLDILSLNNNYSEDDPPTAWIYEKMDMLVLFRRKKLIAHFKWSELKERFKNSKVKIDSGNNKMLSPLMATTLSLFA